MIFQHPTEIYFRQSADLRLRQQVYRRNVLGDRKVWPKVWNLLLVLSSILLAVNLWFSHLIADLDQALQTAENVRHELTESRIVLLAARDEMYASDNILMLASQKLSLYLPDQEQVKTSY